MNAKQLKFIKEIIPCYQPMNDLPKTLTIEDAILMFSEMCKIREFELNARDLWRLNKIRGMCHLYLYAEAIAVGACKALKESDYITSTHRGHGHVLAKGASPKKMYAELFGKAEGYNKGKGGSMHIADVEAGILGATGIVGSGIAPATGAALSAKMQNNGKVSLCFFGDGGTNQGPFFESLNIAAAWNLPVVFLCENNNWAIGTEFSRVTKNKNVYKRGEAFDIPSVQVDGFNVFAVYKEVLEAADRARNSGGPTLIEAQFMRMLGHHAGDDQSYRSKKELQKLEIIYELDPIKRIQVFLKEHGVTDSKLGEIKSNVQEMIKDAIYFAENDCHDPSADTLFEDLYANNEFII